MLTRSMQKCSLKISRTTFKVLGGVQGGVANLQCVLAETGLRIRKHSAVIGSCGAMQRLPIAEVDRVKQPLAAPRAMRPLCRGC